MKIFEKTEIVDNLPALYIEKIDSVVISDLHLGLESLMAKSGTLVPKFQLKEMKEDLEKIIDETDADRLIVCGDIKHDFSETTWGEREEIQELIDFLTKKIDEIFLVKGNHDNYIIYATEDYEEVKLDEKFIIDEFCFMHGDKLDSSIEKHSAKYLIIGHEHPAITMKDQIGVSEKIPCFLYGPMKNDMKLIVMPAFSKFASGSQVNLISESDFMSPVIRKQANIDELKPIGIDREAGKFEFPTIEKLRKLW